MGKPSTDRRVRYVGKSSREGMRCVGKSSREKDGVCGEV